MKVRNVGEMLSLVRMVGITLSYIISGKAYSVKSVIIVGAQDELQSM